MIIRESIWRDIARLIVWFPFRWFITSTPSLKEIPIFRLMGKIHYMISPGKQKQLVENLMLAFGGEKTMSACNKIARRYLENHYVERMVLFLFPKLNGDNITKYHTFENWEKLERRLAGGRGCILVHAHFGAVHLPLFHIGLMGYDIKQVGLLLPPEGATLLHFYALYMVLIIKICLY